MDGVNNVGAAPGANQQQAAQTTTPATPSAEDQAAFDAAVEEFVGAILVGDHFVLQGMIDETMKDATSS